MSEHLDLQDVQRILRDLLEDADFIELSSRTKTLNVFEAVGATRQELRHSNFLAFLLDPAQPHSLDTAFVQDFLVNISSGRSLGSPLNSLEFRLMDLEGIEVRREWNHIDLLLLDAENEWVCAIENKIKSSEHSNQLERYFDTVEAEFPGFESLYVYLSPEGEEPSYGEYLPVSYHVVLDALQSSVNRRRDAVTERAQGILRDYEEIIRRHVVMDSEIAEACRNVYRNHKEAIDLIVEHIPSITNIARDYLASRCEELCEEFDLLEDVHTRTRSIFRFWPEELDIEGLRIAEDGRWTATNRVLLLEVDTRGSSVVLKLVLGPGPKSFRQRVFDWVKTQGRPFKQLTDDTPKKTWQRLYLVRLFSEEQLEEVYLDEGETVALQALDEQLRRNLGEDLPHILEAIQGSAWYQDALEAGERSPSRH